MLKIEILREGFEIDEDDEAGLVIELVISFSPESISPSTTLQQTLLLKMRERIAQEGWS